MSSPSVAVIILNWNGYSDTVECLESLRATNYANYKIVLVDNGSGHDEGLRIKGLFPEVHFIHNVINRGFAGGNNDGIKWALENGFDHVVNLNNDCVVAKDWLSDLIKGITQKGADFGVARIMFYPETDVICSYGESLLFDGSAVSVNQGLKFTGKENGEISFANGAASIYSRGCLEATAVRGGQYFDELFFAYFEDVDLGIRLAAKGYKGVAVPDAVVYHKLGRTAGRFSAFNRYAMEKNRILIALLNYPWYFIGLAEMFYLCRMLGKTFSQAFFPGKRERYRYVGQIGFFGVVSAALKARGWILSNVRDIIDDRRERQSKGMINTRVIRGVRKNS